MVQNVVRNEKLTFCYLPAPSSKLSEPFTAHCKFFRQIYQKKWWFSQNFQIFFFSFQWLFQCFCQVIIPKKILTQVPTVKKIPKMPKKCHVWSLFWPFFDGFLSFWRPSIGGDLRGYSFVFWYVSLQNMKKYNIFSAGKHGTPCQDY